MSTINDAIINTTVPQRGISRRSALRTGGIAAIVAGLIGTAGTAPVAATDQPVVLARVVNADDIRAEGGRLLADMEAQRAEYEALQDALYATLTPAQAALCGKMMDAFGGHHSRYSEWVSVEMARHMPGLAGVMRLLWAHAVAEPNADMGACCTDGTLVN
jgi:hypothetical protein